MNTAFLRSLHTRQDGNVAILMALAVIPIFAVIGLTVDSSRQDLSVNHIQAASDSASLVGARLLEDGTLNNAQVRAQVIENFDANLETAAGDQDCRAPEVNINREEGIVRVVADCSVNSLFGDAFWNSELKTDAVSSAQASITRLDLGLMLDLSGSMRGDKIDALKEAAKNMADILITPRSGDRVRIGYATYATSVNAGAFADNVVQGWQPGDTTCVVERQGSGKYSDAAPGPAGGWIQSRNDNNCPSASLLPITADINRFKNSIDSLTTGGWTAGHSGAAWAWYLISPSWGAIWPAESRPMPYFEDEKMKAVVLMTDGIFNMYGQSSGSTSSTQSQSRNHALQLCRNMRRKEVLVFTVAFDAPFQAEQLLRDCADDQSRFYTPDNEDELIAAFESIASQLTKLAITE